MGDFKNRISYFIPEILHDKPDFNVFTQLSAELFGTEEDLIDGFTSIIDADTAPREYLTALYGNLGYELTEHISTSFAREALSRILDIYRNRGTESEIVQAATHGSNVGWMGSSLFDPQYEITDERASILNPMSQIFTASVSTASGEDVLSDGDVWRYGVVLVRLPYMDSKVQEAILATLPAGLRPEFEIQSTFMGNKYRVITGWHWDNTDYVLELPSGVQYVQEQALENLFMYDMNAERDKYSIEFSFDAEEAPSQDTDEILTFNRESWEETGNGEYILTITLLPGQRVATAYRYKEETGDYEMIMPQWMVETTETAEIYTMLSEIAYSGFVVLQ